MLYGNGTTRLETYSRSLGDSETDTWKFLRTKSKNCNTSVFEAGYYFLVDKFGASTVDSTLTTNPNAGYLAVLASPDEQIASDAHLYVKNNSDTMYAPKSLVELCKTVELTQEVLITDTTITIKDASDITTSAFLKINNELMYITSISSNILTVSRAILDTVPEYHTSDSRGFVFSKQNILNNLYDNTNDIDVKVVTNAEGSLLSLSNASVSNVGFDSRSIRPYPPVNVKINDEYFPEEIASSLVITWAYRDRLDTNLGTLSWYVDGLLDVLPSTSTTLTIEEYDLEMLTRSTVVDVTGLRTYTFPSSSMLNNTRHIRVSLKTTKDGYDCSNVFKHQVELNQFFSAPYNLTYTVRTV